MDTDVDERIDAMTRAAGPVIRTEGLTKVYPGDIRAVIDLNLDVNEGDEVSKKCLEETGIKIEYITATTDDVTKRVVTQPNSFDVLDTEYFSLKKLIPGVHPKLPGGAQEEVEAIYEHAEEHRVEVNLYIQGEESVEPEPDEEGER